MFGINFVLLNFSNYIGIYICIVTNIKTSIYILQKGKPTPYTTSTNYLNYPNLLFIVNKSKKIEENEIIKPNIIIGFDLTFLF